MKAGSKLISGLMMTAIMLVSFGGGLAYAAGGSYDQKDTTASTEVAFTQTDTTYTVSIPDKISLKEDDSVTEDIEITNANIRKEYAVQVKIKESELNTVASTSGKYISLVAAGKGTVASWITHGSVALDGSAILYVEKDSPASDMKTTIEFSKPYLVESGNLTEGEIPDGNYTGTLNFEIECNLKY